MKTILGYSPEELNGLGGAYTGNEIEQQPEAWNKLFEEAKTIKNELRTFLDKALFVPNVQIILTGAGTSAYIGDALEGIIKKRTNKPTRAISTTDLITNPDLYLVKDQPLLLISFARSGNSPESSQVIEIAEQFSQNVYHLIITCNKKSALTEKISQKNHFIFYMPPETNDESLAMTSSFTTMLLAGIFLSRINEIEKLEKQLRLMREYGEKIFSRYLEPLKKIAELDFDRAVFLGSGSFKGIARESQLKLQELTDGQVICKFDSFLGFRHGPKCVVNEKTLVVYIFSNNGNARKYELDLMRDMNGGRKGKFTVGIMGCDIKEVKTDLKIILSDDENKLDEDFLLPVSVIPAQILGFYKSLHLKLKPDSPSDSGMIHRVVQGVNIYPYIMDGSDGL